MASSRRFVCSIPSAQSTFSTETSTSVQQKGDPDLAGAARTVLRDWSHGKLARYTVPPSTSSSDNASQPEKTLADAYAKDEAVLSQLATRKELRKAGGLVKLRTGEVDRRRVMLDAGYFVSSSDDGVEGDEEDGGAIDDADEIGLEGEDSDEEDDYVSDEEEGSDEEDEDEVEGGSLSGGVERWVGGWGGGEGGGGIWRVKSLRSWSWMLPAIAAPREAPLMSTRMMGAART